MILKDLLKDLFYCDSLDPESTYCHIMLDDGHEGIPVAIGFAKQSQIKAYNRRDVIWFQINLFQDTAVFCVDGDLII